jgi:hypothetical protein
MLRTKGLPFHSMICSSHGAGSKRGQQPVSDSFIVQKHNFAKKDFNQKQAVFAIDLAKQADYVFFRHGQGFLR